MAFILHCVAVVPNSSTVISNARNRLVNFRILDVLHPEPGQLLRELHGEDLLQGLVVDVSHGASPEANFVVVQVDELRHPVVVAANHVMEVM
jgi:hypothetical protein